MMENVSCRVAHRTFSVLRYIQRYQYQRTYSTVATATLQQEDEWNKALPYDKIPGPKPLPLIGNLYRFIPGFRKYDFSNLSNLHGQLRDEFGELVRFSHLGPRRDIVLVYKPEDVERVYRNEGMWPERPAFRSLTYYREVTRKDFFQGESGVLVDQGEAWQKARSQVNPVLMQTRTVQLYASRIDHVAEDFIARMPDFINKENELPDDFANELHKWALESIAMVALDTRLGCLEPNLSPDSEPQRMIDAVHTMFKCLHILEVESLMWNFVSTPTWRKFIATLDYFVEVSMKYIDQAIERGKYRAADDMETSVLERFVKRDPNPKRAVIMALDMLFAGVDTTSHALSNVLLHLSKDQEKQEKLLKELLTLMPDPATPLTTETLNEMRYLRACIKESMRLTPIVAANARTTHSEIVLSNYRIPKGVDIIMTNALMSRDEKNYPSANKYLPERWLRHGTENPFPDFKVNPFVSLPFGHGSRKCVGMRFATLEMEMLLAKLIRRFKWEWNQPEMTYKSALITKPADPLRFTVYPRQ